MASVHILVQDDSQCCGRRRAAARARSGHGSLSPGAALACRLAPPRCEDCLGLSSGRTVGGGFCTCQRGNPHRLVAPGGVLLSYSAPPPWGAPGPLGTVVAGGLRCALGSPGIQGCPRPCAFAWRYGCAGLRVGTIASVIRSLCMACLLFKAYLLFHLILPCGHARQTSFRTRAHMHA